MTTKVYTQQQVAEVLQDIYERKLFIANLFREKKDTKMYCSYMNEIQAIAEIGSKLGIALWERV